MSNVSNTRMGGRNLAARRAGLAFVLLALGCNEEGAARPSTLDGGGGEAGETTAATDTGAAAGRSGWGVARAPKSMAVSDAWTPQSLHGTPGSGDGGAGSSAPEPIVAPYGISLSCGDGIVGIDEECDDGPGTELDACTASCQTRDQPVAAVAGADRYLGAGRHPVSGLSQGFATTYVEVGTGDATVGASLFNIWGQPTHHVTVSDGASPIDEANPVAAALPDGSFAIAWGDFDGDGSDLGVALRKVNGDGTLGALGVANAGAEFSQLNPDMIWTGSQLVVAWEDYADANNGPDIRYRLFDADLNPLSDDASLAASALPEAAVALAPFNGGWAAAYREGTVDGQENVVVRVGDASFRVGPVLGGPLDDRPALVALDTTRLLVAFSIGTDPSSTGVYNLARVRYAVVDTEAGAVAPVIKSLDPQDEVLTSNDLIAQTSPALVAGNDGPYLAWRSEARSGDVSGDQLWLKRLPWVEVGGQLLVNAELPEMLIPRVCEDSGQDQRSPALAQVALPPGNALAIAWTDYGKTQGAGAGEPDVVVHYAPTVLPAVAGAPQSLSDTFSAATGAKLAPRWVTHVVPPLSWSVQASEAQFAAVGAPGTSFAMVSDHLAKDVDIVTTMRFAYPTTSAIIARADELPTPETYLAAQITSFKYDLFRIYAVINGVSTDLATMPAPWSFWDLGVGTNVDHRVRFRALTNADGSLFLGMKVWRVGATEPAAWPISTTLPPTDPAAQTFGNVAGRFGLRASVLTANGNRFYYDDFAATFFEGTADGDLDLSPSPYPLLLRRDAATYRQCSPNSPCTLTGGCCSGDADCQSGLACSHFQAAGLGAGSHASVCVAAHCTDGVKSSDETRADCGGADCKACDCTSTATLGASAYCGANCLCGSGDYPCTKDAYCLPGLLCGNDTADLFGGPFQADACVPPHCVNRVLDADEVEPDCGGSCGGGDCTNVCPQANGTIGHCRSYCSCGNGEGHCHQDDECKSGLVCGTRGNRYGFASNIFPCMPASCKNNVRDPGMGETSTDCGGACGCGGCPAGCQTSYPAIGPTIAIPTASAYVESFDSIGTAADATLPSGWRIDKQASPRVVGTFGAAGTTTISHAGGGMSSGSTNSIYNFGAGAAASGPAYWLDSTDRALGWLATGTTIGSGGTKSGNLYVQLQAPASADVRRLTLSYNVEKFRKGTTSPGWKIQLYYSADGTGWGSAGSAFTTTFPQDADADGYDPAPASTTTVTGDLDVFILRDAPFFLAWNYTTSAPTAVDATSAQALAIDDVSILGVVSQ